ncbi:MAG: SprB repeat-containing protein, partial [Bacteroidota bacterium]
WEDDGGSETSFDDGDDDHYAATYTYTIAGTPAGEWTLGTTQGNGTYGFLFQFRYELIQPIERLLVTDGAGVPVGARNLCAGTPLRVTAQRSPGFTGGRFSFARKVKNTETWLAVGPASTPVNYLDITAENLLIYDYRVRTTTFPDCLADPGQTTELPPVTPTIYPSFSGGIPYETVASCENSNTGMVIYTGRDLGADLFVDLVLEKFVGPGFDVVGQPRRVRAAARDTFRNLDGGSYRLKATVVPTEGELANCTSEEVFVLRESFGPVLWETEVVPPTCAFVFGSVRVTIGRRSLRQHTFLLRRKDSGLVSAQSERTFLRDHTFPVVVPGEYLLEVVDDFGCSFAPVPITMPEQPGQASGTVTIIPQSDEFDIVCTGGTTTALVTVPAGEGPYTVSALGQVFPDVPDGGTIEVPVRNFTHVGLTRQESQCSTTLTVNATENPERIALAIEDVVNLTACTPTGGSFTATVTNGVPPYTFSIVDGETVTQDAPTYVFDGLGGGAFRAEVIDGRGCTAGRFAVIGTVDGLELNAAPEPITCIGETDGAVNLMPTAGRAPYQYKIGDGDFQDEATFTGLAAGTYEATVRDADACETTASFTVPDRDEIVITEAYSDPIDCNGLPALSNEGAFNIFVEGRIISDCSARPAKTPTVEDVYEVSFDGGLTFQPVQRGRHLGSGCRSKRAVLEIPGIVSGNYDIQLRDQNGCRSAIFSVGPEVFPEPDPLVATITEIRDATCFGADNGSITVQIEGGNPPFELFLYEFHEVNPDEPDEPFPTDLTVSYVRFTESRTYTFVNLPASTYTPGSPGGYVLGVASDSYLESWDFSPIEFGFFYELPECYAAAPNPTDPTRPIEIFQPDTLIAEEVLLDPASDIQCDGSGAIVTINQVSGGVPPYEYSTTGEAYDPNNVLYPTVAGEPLYVKDANQCVITLPFPDFSLPDSPINVGIEVLSRPSSCTESAVRFTPSGGTPPYTIAVVPFAGAPYTATSPMGESVTIDNINSDFYFVTVQDTFRCRRTVEFELEPGPELQVNTTDQTDESCPGQADGSVTIEITSGNAPYQISYNGNVTTGATRTVTDLAAGVHNFVIVDAENCATVHEAFVNLATELNLEVTTTSPTPCADSENGSMTVTPTGGTPPYQLEWLFDPTLNTTLAAGESATFTDLASIEAEYSMQVTDAGGCSQRIDRFLEWEDPIEVSFFNFNPNCLGPGAINILISNGTPPYQVSINGAPPVTETFFDELPAGDYQFTVTDANGCRYERELVTTLVEVTEIGPLEVITTSAFCYESTGSLQIQAINLQGATFSLNGGEPQDAPFFSDLVPGVYSVEVVLGSCTETVEDITIFGPPLPTVIQDRTEDPCTGEVELSLTAESRRELVAYAIDGTPYIPGTPLRFLPGNSYELTITDVFECVYTEIIDLPAFTPLTITGADILDALCEDGTGQAAVTVVGGTPPYSFNWSGGGPADSLFLGAAAGAYRVTVSDVNGCALVSDELTIELLGDGRPVISLQEVQPANCEEGTGAIVVSVSSGVAPYTYTWSHDATINEPVAGMLNGGSYDLTVTDVFGCSSSREGITVGFNPAPELELITVSPTCGEDNGSITALASGGQPPYTYSWSHDPDYTESTLENIGGPAGVQQRFNVTVMDANGCQAITGVAFTPGASLQLTVLTNEPSTCGRANGRLEIGVSGDPFATTTVAWAHDPDLTDTALENLPSGSYFLTVTDNRGCSASGEYIVTNADGPALENTTVVDALCTDGTGRLSFSIREGAPPYTYRWEHDPDLRGNAADNLAAGTYRLTVTDANDCELNLLEEIAFISPPAVNLTPILPSCEVVNSGRVTSDVTGGTLPFTYRWSNGSDQSELTDVPAGEYGLTLTDANDCVVIATTTVASRMPPAVELTTSTNVACAEVLGAAVFRVSNVSDAATFTFSDPGIIPQVDDLGDGVRRVRVNALPAGDYQLTVEETDCIGTQSVTIGNLPGFTLEVIDNQAVTCSGEADGAAAVAVVGGNLDYTFRWDAGAGNAAGPSVNNLPAGTYGVTVTSNRGCTQRLEITIDDGSAPALTGIPADTTLCLGNLYVLDLSEYPGAVITGPEGFRSTDPVSLLETAGAYQIEYTDDAGCTVSQTTDVKMTTERFTARMVLPTDAVVTLPVAVLEAGFPAPDQVEWVVDESRVTRTDQVDNVHFFEFSEPGVYDIGMVASAGGCEDAISKQITIHADSTTIPGAVLGATQIVSTTVAPNPNQGTFTFLATLASPQPLTLTFFRSDGSELNRRRVEGLAEISEGYAFDLEAGTYYLQAQAGNERRLLAIIVQ